jgi:hypothetical protein
MEEIERFEKLIENYALAELMDQIKYDEDMQFVPKLRSLDPIRR